MVRSLAASFWRRALLLIDCSATPRWCGSCPVHFVRASERHGSTSPNACKSCTPGRSAAGGIVGRREPTRTDSSHTRRAKPTSAARQAVVPSTLIQTPRRRADAASKALGACADVITHRPRARRRAIPRPDARGLRAPVYEEAPRPRAAVEVFDMGAGAARKNPSGGPRGLPGLPVNSLLDTPTGCRRET